MGSNQGFQDCLICLEMRWISCFLFRFPTGWRHSRRHRHAHQSRRLAGRRNVGRATRPGGRHRYPCVAGSVGPADQRLWPIRSVAAPRTKARPPPTGLQSSFTEYSLVKLIDAAIFHDYVLISKFFSHLPIQHGDFLTEKNKRTLLFLRPVLLSAEYNFACRRTVGGKTPCGWPRSSYRTGCRRCRTSTTTT